MFGDTTDDAQHETPPDGGGREAPLREVLRQASARLAVAGIDGPGVDASVLMAHVLEIDASELRRRTLLGHTFPVEAAEWFAPLLTRRCAREPLQHLTGRAPFRHLELSVGPGVFVPRPETETVAELAIGEARRARDGLTGRNGEAAAEAGGRSAEPPGAAVDAAPVVIDLCTGSGAIALSVADEVPGVTVHAVELSEEAAIWARGNIAATGLPVTLHVDDVTGDLATLSDLRGRVAVVVSNPPYIPPDAVPVDVEVAEHDPHMALYGGGDDGLLVPKAVIEAAAVLLRPGGLLVMEHASVQSDALLAVLAQDGRWSEIAAHDDLTGRPRAVSARCSEQRSARLLDCSP